MKKQLILSLALVASVFSCTTDDTSDIVINSFGTSSTSGQVRISGNKTVDLTLESNTSYLLDGPLVMAAGTTLTIPPCTTIKALASGAVLKVALLYLLRALLILPLEIGVD